jgi:hypothetical protein
LSDERHAPEGRLRCSRGRDAHDPETDTPNLGVFLDVAPADELRAWLDARR